MDVQLEEPYGLGDMFIEDVNFDQINDVVSFHFDCSNIIEIIDGSSPYTMHNMIQSSKWNSTIIESHGSHYEVEALQILLMVMSGSHDSGKDCKPNHIWIFSQNYFLFMISLDVNPFLKYVW